MSNLGRFELREVVGQGGAGVVHRAFDPSLGRDVAIKLLRGPLGPQEAARFVKESEAAAALQHPHVVRLHESGIWQGQPYLVMEWVEGWTLREELRRRGRFTPGEACALLAPVAGALAAAHALGIVHRDVKPENLLLTRDGRALLGDFGVVRMLDQDQHLTRTGEVLGTPGYMPREQIEGKRVGPAADVFALCVVLHELLSGRAPFAGESLLERMRATVSSTPASLASQGAEVAAELQALVLRGLDPDPVRRPSAGELERLLLGLKHAAPRGRVAALQLLAAGVLLAGGATAAVALLATRFESTPVAPVGAAPLASSAPVRVAPVRDPQRELRAGLARSRTEPGVYEWTRAPGRTPIELVWIPAHDDAPGLFLARHELSWGEYLEFHAATGKKRWTREDSQEELASTAGTQPAALTWLEALEYCAWAGARLPTLAEWMRAAALEGTIEPRREDAPLAGPAPVRSAKPGKSGCVHLAGNVREWVQDPGSLAAERLLCGGSLANPSLTEVTSLAQGAGTLETGVRLVIDVDPRGAPRPAGAITPPLTWEVEAVAFAPLPQERDDQATQQTGFVRSYEQLSLVATKRFPSVLVPGLRLPFGTHGPGELFPGVVKRFPPDFFALRAHTRAWLGPGRWRLEVVEADDGVRVWKDEELLIDGWQHAIWSSKTHGDRLIRVFELAEPAEVSLRVEHLELWGSAALHVVLRAE